MTHNTQDWRDKFRNKFWSVEHGLGYSAVQQPTTATMVVEVFIEDLLTSQLQNVVEELEGMKQEEDSSIYCNCDGECRLNGPCHQSYNQALSDAQTIIRDKMEKK